MTLHVVIADDLRLVRAGFHHILEAETGIDVVAEAGGGLQAINAIHHRRPDVFLMDMRMPELDGVEATRRHLVDDLISRGSSYRQP